MSYDTAEQSIVSHSEVSEHDADDARDVLTVTEDNPETLALAVSNNRPTNNNIQQLRLNIPTKQA